MAEFFRPGVFIEEIERGPRPIEGVPTSTAAFLGATERGPLRPMLVTSYNDYRRLYGDPFADDQYMPHAVNGFFENGGKRLYVARLVRSTATTASRPFGPGFTMRAAGPGAWGERVWASIDGSSTKVNGVSVGFRLRLAYYTSVPNDEFPDFDPFDPDNSAELPRPAFTESYDDLSADPNSADYFVKRLTDPTTNRSISLLAFLDASGAAPGVSPSPGAGRLDGGADGDGALTAPDYEGRVADARQELQGLEQLRLDPFREVALIYAPRPSGAGADAINQELISYAENNKFVFAVIDSARNVANSANLDPRTTLADTQYAAFYYPWIVASDPLSGARRLVPPGGHVLGVYARTDNERGVFKAPANETLRGALDLEFDIDDGRQEILNPRGVNVTRRFPGRGIRVWGARTLSSNALWKYVSVRRLFIFIERSIFEGTQFAVFEPNDERLWARVKDSVRLFLRTQFRAGALFGATENEAFFITCDRTTMTQDDILNGRLICEIGIAPVRPAEFVIFRIFQNTAEAQR